MVPRSSDRRRRRSLDADSWSIPTWFAAAIALSVFSYVAATASLLGALPVRLSFGPAFAAQLASSFANRVTPAKVGGVATNVRYLQRQGVSTSVAGTAIGLNGLVGFVVHVALIVLFLGISQSGGGVSLPTPSSQLVVGIAVLLLVSITTLVTVPFTRRLVGEHVVPHLRAGVGSIKTIMRSPDRLALLFGGSAAITLAYAFAMVASLEAFG